MRRTQHIACAAMALLTLFSVAPASATSLIGKSPVEATSTGLAVLDRAIVAQNSGNVELAIDSYDSAITSLNIAAREQLAPFDAKVIRDRLALCVMQLALLLHAKQDPRPYLAYAYKIEAVYLGFEIARANQLFDAGKYNDAFEIYGVFEARSPRSAGARQHRVFAAIDAAKHQHYEQARRLLVALLQEPSEYGDSEILFLLGETDRALRRPDDAADDFWLAVDERESSSLRYGMWAAQICSADALLHLTKGPGR